MAGMAVAQAARYTPREPHARKARLIWRGCSQRPSKENHVKRVFAVICAAFASLAFAVPSFAATGASDITPDALVKSTADEVLSIIRTTKDKKVLREAAE